MKVLMVGGGWSTNIGNAFIDMGVQNVVKEVLGVEPMLYNFVCEHMHYSIGQLSNAVNPIRNQKFDLIIAGGMCCCKNFARFGAFIEEQCKNGAKFAILGGGMGEFDEEEVAMWRAFMKQVKPIFFISRDQKTFDQFHDLAPSMNGIDMGFFVPDYFSVQKVANYTVAAFDSGPPQTSLPHIDIQATHSVFDLAGKRLNGPMFVSDTPWCYFELYGGCDAVYSDRVHACVLGLAYGNKARFLGNTPRVGVLDRVGYTTQEEATGVDMDALSVDKGKVKEFFLKAMKNA